MTLYIGIDLSTDPANTGIAVLTDDDQNGVDVHWVREGFWCGTVTEWNRQFLDNFNDINGDDFPAKAARITRIVQLIVGNMEDVIIAIDVPFGWPITFREQIANHVVGNAINADIEQFCYRNTERILIHAPLSLRTPLSVSTDKIGRTAMLGSMILSHLQENRYAIQYNEINADTPLKVIEVYPTASAYALSPEQPNGNFTLSAFYNTIFRMQEQRPLHDGERIDTLDAVVAAYTAYLAANDDGRGAYFTWPNPNNIPVNAEIVTSEGWIWCPYRNAMDRVRNDHFIRLSNLLIGVPRANPQPQ